MRKSIRAYNKWTWQRFHLFTVCVKDWEPFGSLACAKHALPVGPCNASDRESDPREHRCTHAKPVACTVPDCPSLCGMVLTAFSQHQASVIKSHRWEWLFVSGSRNYTAWVRYVGLVRGCPLRDMSVLWKIWFIESSSDLPCR